MNTNIPISSKYTTEKEERNSIKIQEILELKEEKNRIQRSKSMPKFQGSDQKQKEET